MEIWQRHASGLMVSAHGRADTPYKGKQFGCVDSGGYMHVKVNGRPTRVHRLVAETFWPNPRPDVYDEIDHIDRNRKNNRISNLHWSNRVLNCLNNDADNVYLRPSGKWEAAVQLHGKQRSLGTYVNREDGRVNAQVFKALAIKMLEARAPEGRRPNPALAFLDEVD